MNDETNTDQICTTLRNAHKAGDFAAIAAILTGDGITLSNVTAVAAALGSLPRQACVFADVRDWRSASTSALDGVPGVATKASKLAEGFAQLVRDGAFAAASKVAASLLDSRAPDRAKSTFATTALNDPAVADALDAFKQLEAPLAQLESTLEDHAKAYREAVERFESGKPAEGRFERDVYENQRKLQAAKHEEAAAALRAEQERRELDEVFESELFIDDAAAILASVSGRKRKAA